MCSYDRPTDFLSCNSEHAIDDVDVNAWRPRGTTDPRPSCKMSERHLFWRLQDTRSSAGHSRARNRNKRNTIGEPPITPIAGRVTTPTGDSLTHHSLTIHWHARGSEPFLGTRARKRRKRALPTSRNSLSVAFQFDPAPGDVVSCRSMDHKSILLGSRARVDQNLRIIADGSVIRESSPSCLISLDCERHSPDLRILSSRFTLTKINHYRWIRRNSARRNFVWLLSLNSCKLS